MSSRLARVTRLCRGLVPLLAVLLVPPALGFHSGGVASCGGCHDSHDESSSSPFEENPTDVCLRCHATSYGNSWGGAPLSPGPVYGGGPFVFLLEDNLNDGPGGGDPARWIGGEHAGHSVISASRGTTPDPDFTTSPGGSYPASNLHCTSCHDPHGRGGHFRFLYGTDFPDAEVDGRVFTYTRPAPQAEGIPLDGPPESNTHHTAYRSGMSEWCGNCHGAYHDLVGSSKLEHPSDERLGAVIMGMYNRYRGTGHLDGTGTNASLVAVPLEFPGANIGFGGRAPSEGRVMCLSCHRAHASSGPRSGRWDFNITTWSEEGVLSGSYPIPNPYESTSGRDQRQLCDKCHGEGGGEEGSPGPMDPPTTVDPRLDRGR